MKKLLTLLLIIVIALTICMPVYADGSDVDVGVNPEYDGNITIETHTYSTYSITIPFELTAWQQDYIYIRNANIENGYHLSVYATNLNANGMVDVYATAPNGEEVAGAVKLSVDGTIITEEDAGLLCEFTQEELIQPTASRYLIAIPSDDNTVAGVYRGTLCIRVACTPNE